MRVTSQFVLTNDLHAHVTPSILCVRRPVRGLCAHLESVKECKAKEDVFSLMLATMHRTFYPVR